jgi:glycerate kinase
MSGVTSPAGILIAPNAFKNSLTAIEVAESIEKGLKKLMPDEFIQKLPVADGGDGSLAVISSYLNLKTLTQTCLDPLGREIHARLGMSSSGEAYIEMALASGIQLLVAEERNAGKTHSGGTGKLIRRALEEGATTIHLFVGGTATMDMGTGILRSLGFRFLDKQGDEVAPGGIHLAEISEIVYPTEDFKNLSDIPLKIYSDVESPLLGKRGAVAVFGPQKDRGDTDMDQLESSFQKFTALLEKTTGKSITDFPGSGAAGGTPAGLSAFLNVEIKQGAENILDLLDFERHLQNSRIVITGEGKLDDQSMEGKAPFIIAKRSHKQNKKVIFVGGNVPDDTENEAYSHYDAIFSILPYPADLDQAMTNSAKWLERTAYLIAKMLYL